MPDPKVLITRARELLIAVLRPSRPQVAWALALCLVAMAVVVQVQSTRTGDRYAGMRRDDLVALLDGLSAETERLQAEVAELERTRDALQSGADAQEIAQAEAQRRADGLGILAGTLPAVGPGVRITISAPQGRIKADLLLDAIQELRDAGAEVIELNDRVRLVAQSWVADGPVGLIVDDQELSLPITIDAIGDPHSLAEGMRFRGGLVSQVQAQQVGGSVEIEELEQVEITALHEPAEPQYARPA